MASDYEHLKLGALALVHTGNLDHKTHSVLVNLINFLFEELMHRQKQTRDGGGFSTEISVKNKPPQNENVAESIDSNDRVNKETLTKVEWKSELWPEQKPAKLSKCFLESLVQRSEDTYTPVPLNQEVPEPITSGSVEFSQKNEDQESAKSLNKSVTKREETTEVKLREDNPELESASKVFLSELESTSAVTSDDEEEKFSIGSGSFTPSDLKVSRKISSLPDEEVLAKSSSSPSHQEVSRHTHKYEKRKAKNEHEVSTKRIKTRQGHYCCVVNCHNNSARESHLKFWIFPNRDQQQRALWIKAVGRKNPDGSDWNPKISAQICSAHFIGGIKSNIQTHPSYAPTIFPSRHKKENSTAAIDRFNRFMTRRMKKE